MSADDVTAGAPDDRRAVVTRPWTRVYEAPIVLAPGDPVTLGRRDDEYPGWVWCTSPASREGWVPDDVLQVEGDRAHAREAYDAIELTVAAGDAVTVLRELRGWAWCRDAAGEAGWVPQSHLDRS